MVSIKDVAKRAGVAISTVSKVLNNYPNVTEATKEKVNNAVKELGFVPNPVAAALSSKQAGRVALLLDLGNSLQSVDEINLQYIKGAISEAEAQGLDIITIFYSMICNKSLEEIVEYFKFQSISGIIVCGLHKENDILHELIEKQIFKVVVIDAPISNETTSSVWVDQENAQYDIAKKTLVENECKSILYIAGRKDEFITDARLAGIKRLAEEMDAPLTIRYGDFSELQARNITFKYAKNKDVVVCASDMMAIGAMRALMEMDIFRPVCGFDGIGLMAYAGMQMNTVKQDFTNVAAEAVREMKSLFEGEKGKNRVLPYELVRIQYLESIR